MPFTLFTDLKRLDEKEIQEQILSLKKELFTLRLKKATRQSVKPHMFKHARRKLTQLLTLQLERTKNLR